MNALNWNSFDETDTEFSLASTDDLIRFWRSEVKVMVTAGSQGQILWMVYLMGQIEKVSLEPRWILLPSGLCLWYSHICAERGH